MGDFSYIEQNLSRVTAELCEIAARTGQREAMLLPVTKGATDEEVLALLSYGVTAIAENRTNLFLHRKELAEAAGYRPDMHLIGSLQKNKVKYIADSVALIHSLDSLSLASEIERQADKHGVTVPVLIEVNSGREAAKGGVLPEDALSLAKALSAFPHLALAGVMTMAPNCESEEDYRPYFRETRAIFDRIAVECGYKTASPVLSMGMSDSYRIAAEEGATVVRVGTTLFRKAQL